MKRQLIPLFGAAGAMMLAGCERPIDLDLRSLGRGFSTTAAAQQVGARPQADTRGVISYPSYQVALARRGDTVRSVALRLGLDPATLASHNALTPDTALREGELLALPGRPGNATTPGVSATTLPGNAEPLRHRVSAGETAFSIARLYDVPVQAVAEWNGLSGDMAVRPGQTLLVPVAGGVQSAPLSATTAPGEGSPTPTPPSSTTPLPTEQTQPIASAAPALPAAPAQPTTAASQPATARMVMPVTGAIIREYAAGRNEGIDISAPAGTSVKAADAGSVAAITQDTNGAQIVVLRHSGGLLTVYVNVADLTIGNGASVVRGQTIGKVAAGDPPALHFEVRNGLESVDPGDYLP